MGIGKRLVLLLLGVGLIAFAASPALAQQTGKIVGKVTDTRTGQPLGSANVLVEGTKLGASTDLDGVYFILNVPPGTYTVQASILGYKPIRYENVRVSTGLTTTLDFELEETVMEAAEAVTFVAERPLIQKDQTESRTTRSAEDIEMMPVRTVNEVVQLTAGTVGGNFRGGRGSEVAYLVDGALMVDPMTGNQENNIPMIAFEEINVITGGMSAEYGNALSGVVSQVTKEGNDRLSGAMKLRTNDMASTFIGQHDQLKEFQGSLSGRVPFFPKSLGDIYFFGSGLWLDTKGRFEHDDQLEGSAFGKLTYKLSPQHKLTVSGSFSNTWWNNYGHLWSRDTDEDLLAEYSPDRWDPEDGEYPFYDANGNSWYGNGQIDMEDGFIDGVYHPELRNGILDPGEDLNGNGFLDSEDLNNNAVRARDALTDPVELSNSTPDVYNMQEHQPYFNQHTNSFSVKWNHALSSKSFYEISLSRYQTKAHYNTREKFNEDVNGNGWLDLEESYSSINEIPQDMLDQYGHLLLSNSDQSFFWIDRNGNGVYEYEDVNGNEMWDWAEYGPNYDMIRDDDDDGFIDASQNGPRDTWLQWEDIPFNVNYRDEDDYYMYGRGTTYNRNRWNNDDKITWTVNANATGQVHRYHQLKSGIEMKFYDIVDHDVDMASGGNVYGQDIAATPRSYGGWVEDKMEFEGMIVNLGMRLDVFDVNWDRYPSDLSDPVLSADAGGSEVKDPVSLDPETYWSPRLGVAFPITERDLLSFNYSRNFQIPVFNRLFTNSNWDFSGAFPIIGNPGLEPERTTSYELTLRHQFSDDLVVVTTGFYKDISGLVDTRQVFYTSLNWYGLYINRDYGNVRGFELSLEKRFSNFYSGNISYTYSVAKGKSSSTTQGYLAAYNGTIPRTTESYLDWDQRHTVYGNLQFMVPKGTRLMGQSWLDEVSMSVIGRYGSGLPYSSPPSGLNPPVNDMRLPYTLEFDGRVQKRFSMTKSFGFYAYLAAYNMFDQRNIDQRYFQAAANIEWYENTDENNIQRGAPGYNDTKDVDGQYDNPQFWQRGRRYELGVGIDF
jgi:outer membrane receptor protein involved in Fe transport